MLVHSQVEFNVVRATRTENTVIREGWIVELHGDGFCRHASVLFWNYADAIAEARRLAEEAKHLQTENTHLYDD
jgi:hypothetical protein